MPKYSPTKETYSQRERNVVASNIKKKASKSRSRDVQKNQLEIAMKLVKNSMPCINNILQWSRDMLIEQVPHAFKNKLNCYQDQAGTCGHHQLRKLTSRTQQSTNLFNAKASSASALFDSTSASIIVEDNNYMISSADLEQECPLPQQNLSQNATLSFPLELLSGTVFAYSQQSDNLVAAQQNVCSEKLTLSEDTPNSPKLDANFANTETPNPGGVQMFVDDTKTCIESLPTSTSEPKIEISASSDFPIASQNGPFSQLMSSNIIIDASFLSNDLLNHPSIQIGSSDASSSNINISSWVAPMKRSDMEMVIVDDSQQTCADNDNLESSAKSSKNQQTTNMRSEQVNEDESQNLIFSLDRGAVISGSNTKKDNICDDDVKDETGIAKRQEDIAPEVSISSDTDIIAETQRSVSQDGTQDLETIQNSRTNSSYKSRGNQSNSFLNYKYSGRCRFSLGTANCATVCTKDTAKDTNLNNEQHKAEFQANGISEKLNQKDVSKTESLFEEIQKVQNEMLKARAACLAKWRDAPVSNKLTRKFVEKFCVNIFEEPAESVINIDYKPTFHELHFARSTMAKMFEIIESSMAMTQLMDETLTKIVAEHCDGSDHEGYVAIKIHDNGDLCAKDLFPVIEICFQSGFLPHLLHLLIDSSSHSENEESKTNKTWLREYVNKTKHVRKGLMQVKMEHSDSSEIGKNLRESCKLQEDSSKDEELQEILQKFSDCKWLKD